MNSGAEKRLLETNERCGLEFVYTQTAVMQHCISTRQRAQGEQAAAAAIGEAAVIKPYGDGWWSECGECECVDLQTEGERERERTSRTGRVTVSMRRLTPTIMHQMKPPTYA